MWVPTAVSSTTTDDGLLVYVCSVCAMSTAKRGLYLVLTLVGSQCATTADTDAQSSSNLVSDGILRAEITQTQQLRHLAEAQQRQIQSLEAQLHFSCDVLWQTDA